MRDHLRASDKLGLSGTKQALDKRLECCADGDQQQVHQMHALAAAGGRTTSVVTVPFIAITDPPSVDASSKFSDFSPLSGRRRIVQLAGIRPSFSSLGQPGLRIWAEAQRLFFAVDAVLAAPQLAAGRCDDQVQAIAIKQLALLVSRLGVLDFLDRQHLGVFYTPRYIPPKTA